MELIRYAIDIPSSSSEWGPLPFIGLSTLAWRGPPDLEEKTWLIILRDRFLLGGLGTFVGTKTRQRDRGLLQLSHTTGTFLGYMYAIPTYVYVHVYLNYLPISLYGSFYMPR